PRPPRSTAPAPGRREWPGSRSRARTRSPGGARVRHELEEVEPCDDADRTGSVHHHHGCGTAEQGVESLVDVSSGTNRRKGAVHGGADRGLDQSRVAVDAVQQAALLDAADQQASLLVLLDYRHL